tara:strand:+ start:759 stop:1049 length:291 start_codon:yes stop_codon:yes gene_type:complete
MAEEKIPSPKEITGEVQKFTKEEIDNLRNFQARMDQVLLQLGRIHLSKNKLNEQEDILKSEIKKLETEEVELAKSLSEKYGKGSLDIETGTFTPIE